MKRLMCSVRVGRAGVALVVMALGLSSVVPSWSPVSAASPASDAALAQFLSAASPADARHGASADNG